MRSERERLIARRGVLEARLALLTSNPNTPDELGDRLRAQLDEVATGLEPPRQTVTVLGPPATPAQ